jgi:hypothetical protein
MGRRLRQRRLQGHGGDVKRYLDDETTYAAQRNYGRVQTATINGDADTVLAVVR